MNKEIKEVIDFLKICVREEAHFSINRENSKILLDYITDLQLQLEDRAYEQLKVSHKKLQEENERLKEKNKRIFANVNDDQLLRSNAMNYAEAQDYKSRCEKALEYIKEKQKIQYKFALSHIECDELESILQGSDKSE